VAVIAPAAEGDGDAGIASIETAGHPVVRPDTVRLGGDWTTEEDVALVQELHRHLRERDVGALFCLRGGYGSGRLVPHLDPEAWQAARLPLVGMSDITALHLWLQRRCGLQSLYGPVVAGGLARGLAPEDEAALWSLLAGEPPDYPEGEVWRSGHGAGPLTGGCLTLLCSSIGTPWEVETAGRCLFIEEVNEPPYAIDRSLTQLRQADKLDHLAGVLVGTFHRCGSGEAAAATIRASILEATAASGCPVVAGVPCGHGDRQMALPLGAECAIDDGRYRFGPPVNPPLGEGTAIGEIN
jgi:muramoyltetrapeptide carboxypeptidase